MVLYQSASTTSAVLATLTSGTAVTVYSNTGGWLYVGVTSLNATGYVLAAGVTYNSASSGTTVTGSATTTTSVNLRSGPGTGYSSGGTLPAGTALTVNSVSGTWYYVTVTSTGKTGYVHSSYVTLSGTGSSTVVTGSENGYVTARSLNLRKGPGTKYASISKLAYGTAVTIVNSSGKWYYVNVGSTGTAGYVYSSYISRGAAVTTPSTTVSTIGSPQLVTTGAYVY